MSVVESILFYVLKAHSQLPTTQWQEVRSNIISPAFSHEGVDMRLQTTVQKKLQTPEAKMPTLDQMIKRVERKRLLGIDLETYKLLNHLRKLRNKVHIYDVQDRFGTDWNTFSEKDLLNCKRVLFALLSSELFKNSDVSLLGFIQTSIDQKL